MNPGRGRSAGERGSAGHRLVPAVPQPLDRRAGVRRRRRALRERRRRRQLQLRGLRADRRPTPAGRRSGQPGGALRSQDIRTSGDPVTLDGAIIRIDPDTGAALPDNPRVRPIRDANGKRIVAHGLRNPFRFTVRPGTNELWIGDVGWSTWEEINRIVDRQRRDRRELRLAVLRGRRHARAATTADFGICENLYARRGAVDAARTTPTPQRAGRGRRGVPDRQLVDLGSRLLSRAGGTYPDAYNGALFFADYSRNCIWAMRAGADGLPDPADRVTIRSGAPRAR